MKSGLTRVMLRANKGLRISLARISHGFRLRLTQRTLIIERMEVDLVFSRLWDQRDLRILDVGAHHGEFLDIFERHNDDHRYEVICVEPLPENCAVLERKLPRYRRVRARVLRAALSDTVGDKVFFKGSESTLFTCEPTMLEAFPEYFAQHQETAVHCLTVAELIEMNGWSSKTRFDLVKVDTEGHDAHVLRSLENAQVRPFAVIFEVGPVDETVRDGVETLQRLGFHEFYLFGRRGINTTYVGEYVDIAQLRTLRSEGRVDAGNMVAF